MKRKRSRPTAPALWGTAFLLACLLPLLFLSGRLTARAWKGYYTVLIERSPQLAERVSELARRTGIRAVVSRFTSEVSFNTFSGFESVAIARLGERFDPDDPRMDPYMRCVGNFFRSEGQNPSKGGSWEILFVRSGRTPLFLARALFRILAGTGLSWHVLEYDPAAFLLRLLFLVAGAALLLRLPIEGIAWWFPLAGLLPWVLLAAAGDLPDLLAFFIIYPLWLRAIELVGRPRSRRRLRRRPGRKKKRTPWWQRIPAAQIGIAALALALVLLAAPGFRRLAGAGLAVAADLLLVPLLPFIIRRGRRRRAHAPFRPMPILRERLLRALPWLTRTGSSRRGLPPTAAWAAPVLLAALAFCSPLGVLLPKNLRALEVPRLQPSREAISWSSLARLPLTVCSDGLPHLADYVAHRAFQETLAFDRPYGVPAPGERLYLSSYLSSGNRILQTRRVVKRFPDSWLRSLLSASRRGTLERLLADQGRAGRVERVRETAIVLSLRPFLRSAAVAAFLLLRLTAAVLSGKRSFAL